MSNQNSPKFNNKTIDPLGDFIAEYLLTKTEETNYHDFKATLDTRRNSNSVLKLIKHVCGFANAGGGFIVFGVHQEDNHNNELKEQFIKLGLEESVSIDQATLQEKINSYLDTQIEIGYREFYSTFYGKERKFALLYIPPSPKILVPLKDGKYKEGGKEKIVFVKDITYIRRGTQCIQAQDHETNQLKKRIENNEHHLSIIDDEMNQTRVMQRKSVREKITRLSNGTSESIPKRIRDQSIRRDKEIHDVILRLKDSHVVVTGDSGSGKSVLLTQIYSELRGNHTVLFLRGEDYLNVRTLEELLQCILEDGSIESLTDGFGPENKLIIILDSLDAISRNEESMNVFKNLLKKVWGTRAVRTICSVRTYDYEYSPSITTSRWGSECRLDPITNEQLDEVLEKIQSPNISTDLRLILRNPLHLKLYSTILERTPRTCPSSISNEIALYDEHWRTCVEYSDNHNSLSNTLFLVAETMVQKQRISIPTAMLDYDLTEALGQDILYLDRATDCVGFFHHAYLDYVISRRIIANHDSFATFLSKYQYNIFLRPTIVFALTVLNRQDTKRFVDNLREILESDLKFFWKISALTAMSKTSGSANPSIFAPLGDLLSKHRELQRSFLMAVRKEANPIWFGMWKEDFFPDWAAGSESAFVVEYVDSIAGIKELDPYIFRILQAAVKSKYPIARVYAVKAAAKLKMTEIFPWLLELSSSDDLYIRRGIMKAMPSLLDSDQQDSASRYIPDIFANVYSYKEASTQEIVSASYGTLALTSTLKQENHMIICGATTDFPKFLKKHPDIMIMAVIRIFEKSQKAKLVKPGQIVEDNGVLWYESRPDRLQGKDKLLHEIELYLKATDIAQLENLIPLLADARLATWRSVRLSALSMHPEHFKQMIYEELRMPEAYRLPSLRGAARTALGKVASVLDEGQINDLIGIMKTEITFTGAEQAKKDVANQRLAGFLSEIPKKMLDDYSLDLLDKYKERDLTYTTPVSSGVTVTSVPPAVKKEIPLDKLSGISNKDLEHHEKIDVLNNIYKYLTSDGDDPNTDHFEGIKSFLLQNADDPDPVENKKVDGDHVVTHYDSVRGLVAKCMIALLHHTRDQFLMAPIKRLAGDPVGTVRADIADVLDLLFYCDPDAACTILEKYGRDPDRRVRMYLTSSLATFEDKVPEKSAAVVADLLEKSASPESHDGVVEYLLYLALWKKVPRAVSLLNDITKGYKFTEDIRSAIPFILKEHHLFTKEYQDASLEILLCLLDDPSPKVREKAAFFVLPTLREIPDEDLKGFIQNIFMHIDKIAHEVGRDNPDDRIIEHLVSFLKNHWRLLPEKTLACLRDVTKVGDARVSQNAMVASDIVKILCAMHQSNLGAAERKTCLDILDHIASVGWHEALALLESMGRTD